jgi:hypothetical protein
MILMVLKHRRPLPTPEEAMHDLLEGETTASLTKELVDASTGAALVSQCVGHRRRGGRGGNTVDTVEAVEPQIATKVSVPSAKLTTLLQMHTDSGNTLRREETTISAFASSAGFQATSTWIASPTNV